MIRRHFLGHLATGALGGTLATHTTSHAQSAGADGKLMLIGGGPAPQAATWMDAKAGADQLRIVVRDLAGVVKHDVAFKPLLNRTGKR